MNMQDISDLLFHDRVEKRGRWMEVLRDPVWRPLYNGPLEAHRELAYRQLQKVMGAGVVSVQDFFRDPTNIFTAHEMIGAVSGSTVTKFTVHMNLFGGTIAALHTERHRWLFEQLDRLAITGCFCLTELGFGNNAVEMETTSTYDPARKEFVIDSPTTLSQKYWITNGAIHADYALVFAQTIVGGRNEGINAFLVPIRDKARQAMPGVDIHDMGVKMGLNGVDNATLKFRAVRIPRENMLNRYCDVSEEGVFSSQISGVQARFFKVTERLLSGRLCIASMTLGALKTCIYTAVRYAQKRKGVSPNGKSETPIIEYQLQKNCLVPIVARTLGLNMLHNFAKEAYSRPEQHGQDLIMICCADKTLIGWHAERATAVLRERCGGQGFLAANVFAEGMAGAHAALTAEGDNRVLMVKVVKDMLTIFRKDPGSFFAGPYVKVTSLDQLASMDTLKQLFQMRERHLLDTLVARMLQLKGEGLSNYDILMKKVSDEIQDLAFAYAERLAISHCVTSLAKLSEGRPLMQQYLTIFAWEVLLREMATFLLQGWITPEVCQAMRLRYNEFIEEAAKSIEQVVSSLNVPTHAIFAPIANDYVKYNEQPHFGEVDRAFL
jgi:acyl-CoA oxidase